MLKEFASYLVNLGKDREIVTKEIHGDIYAAEELVRVPVHIDRPETVTVNSLDSVAKLLRNELDVAEGLPVYIYVEGPRTVRVFTGLDSWMERDLLYIAECTAPRAEPGWMSQEDAIIKLRSIYVPNEGSEYILDLISRMCTDESVTSDDNGVSQTVTARKGVSLKTFEQVRQRIALRPFRTFTEVEQPESEFILRLSDKGQVGIIEADGGAWKLKAKANIAAYFEGALQAEVKAGQVVVMC